MKIFQKLTLLFLVNAIIPIAIIGFVSYFNTQQAVDQQIDVEINNTANRQIAKITKQVDEDYKVLSVFATRQQLRLSIDQYNKTQKTVDQTSLNTVLSDIRINDRSFRRLHILDMAGTVIGSSDKRFIGRSYHDEPVFKKGSHTPDVSFFFKDIDQKLGHYLASPIVLDGRTIGVALIEYQANSYLLITQDYIDLQKTGESYLVTKVGQDSFEYLSPLRFAPEKLLTTYQLHGNQTEDYRGKSVKMITRDITHSTPGVPWQLVVKIDKDEIYQPVITLRNTTIIVLVVTTIIVFFCGLYFARVFTNPIINLTNKTRLITQGDLAQKIEIASSDEVGALGKAFNQMVETVKQKIDLLHEERIKLQASINSLSVGFIMIDREQNIVTINHTAQQTFCASPNSPLATLAECTLTHIGAQLKESIDLQAFITQCFNTKKTLLIREVKFGTRYLKIFITPIVTIGVIGAVVLIDDITEAKILERSKDEFFSIASHELRTPLTAIKGNSSMIEDFYGEKLNDPQLKEMIRDIHESSNRLIGIVNDFLDMSRLEQGKMEFKRIPTNVVDIITPLIKEYQPITAQRNLTLQFITPSNSLPQVYTDLNKAKQVLINLIGNSLKFTEKGQITISLQIVTGFIKILVSDTGRGISPTNQSLLFRKFQQANTSLLTRDTTKGTGLGLYISRLLVKGLGGSIQLENSVEGKGTTFSFTLPIATVEQLKGTAVKADTFDISTGLTQKM